MMSFGSLRETTLKKVRSLLDPAPDMVYNGIAYLVKCLLKGRLLVGRLLAGPMHQDVGTS